MMYMEGLFEERLRGPLDVDAFVGAWDLMLMRHSMLHTHYKDEGDRLAACVSHCNCCGSIHVSRAVHTLVSGEPLLHLIVHSDSYGANKYNQAQV